MIFNVLTNLTECSVSNLYRVILSFQDIEKTKAVTHFDNESLKAIYNDFEVSCNFLNFYVMV